MIPQQIEPKTEGLNLHLQCKSSNLSSNSERELLLRKKRAQGVSISTPWALFFISNWEQTKRASVPSRGIEQNLDFLTRLPRGAFKSFFAPVCQREAGWLVGRLSCFLFGRICGGSTFVLA